MAKISSSSLLGNLQSQSIKTLGLAKQIDSRTDRNVRRASLMNDSLDQTESEVLAEEAKISPTAMMGESAAPTPENAKGMYVQGFSDAMTSLTKQLNAQKEDQQTDQQGQPGAPGGSPGGGIAQTVGGAVVGGGALAAGGFAALRGTGSIDYVAPGKVSPVISGRYGEQRKTGSHGGTDLAGIAEGTPLRAISDGKIVDGGVNPGGWGNFIVFLDKKGIYHLYGHIQNGYRGKGDVKKGDIIAKVGMTGRTSGPHLHWESGTGWTGGVLTGKFDPLNRYSMHAPFSTARESTAKPAPSTTLSATSALQPPPKPQAQPSASSPDIPQGAQSSQKISSSQPTYSGGSGSSPSTTTAAFLQGLS